MKPNRMLALLGIPTLLVAAFLAAQAQRLFVSALSDPQMAAVTTLTPAPLPTTSTSSTTSSTVRRPAKPAFQQPLHQTPLPSITPSGPLLGVSSQVLSVLWTALPAKAGTFTVSVPNIPAAANEVWVTIETPSKVAYVLQVSVLASANDAYREFAAGQAVQNGKAVAIGEGATINAQGQPLIATMRYRNVITSLYASNAFSTADSAPAPQYLTEAQITDILRLVEQVLQKQVK